METTLRKRVQTPPVGGASFAISEVYERREALRRGDGLTWWDEVRFTLYLPSLLLLLAALIGAALLDLLH